LANYIDNGHKDSKFTVGGNVFIKVALMKEVTCFRMRVDAEGSEEEPMEAPTQQR
jgi:hypothetical protein